MTSSGRTYWPLTPDFGRVDSRSSSENIGLKFIKEISLSKFFFFLVRYKSSFSLLRMARLLELQLPSQGMSKYSSLDMDCKWSTNASSLGQWLYNLVLLTSTASPLRKPTIHRCLPFSFGRPLYVSLSLHPSRTSKIGLRFSGEEMEISDKVKKLLEDGLDDHDDSSEKISESFICCVCL